MASVVISGADGRTAQRLVERLRKVPAISGVSPVAAESGVDALVDALEGADALLHLGYATQVRAALEAADRAGVPTVVYRSSATVYGAWPDNPVPMTEDVPVRPNPPMSFAVEHAEAERLVAEWSDAHPSARVVVLRPAPVVAPGRESWESNVLGRPSSLRRSESLPPTQFLHVDDAVSAFVHAVIEPIRGTFNVAPTGFVSGETARSLATNGRLALPLPDRIASWAESAAWRLGWGGAPASAVPYLVDPWVVANDRLVATGWSPSFTNEEALVASRKGSWWRELSPKRRQELTLSVAGSGALGVGAAIAVAIRSIRRR